MHVLLVSYLFMFEYLAGYLTVLPVMVIRDLTFKGNDKGYFDFAEFPNGFYFKSIGNNAAVHVKRIICRQ